MYPKLMQIIYKIKFTKVLIVNAYKIDFDLVKTITPTYQNKLALCLASQSDR